MTRIPVLTPLEIEKIILAKGFVFVRAKGSHRIYYNVTNKKSVVIPFHRKDLPKGTVLEILKQAGISRDELNNLP